MSSGDGERALLLVGKLLGDLLDTFDLAQDLASGVDDALSSRGDTRQMLAAASKYLDAQFVFEQANLLADPRLRGIQALRCRGDVEVMVRYFPDVAQLLKLHMCPSKQIDATGISSDI